MLLKVFKNGWTSVKYIFLYCCSNKKKKINGNCVFICGCYDSVHDACCWQANWLVLCKTLSSGSGQSIYLAHSHFICENSAWWTVVQSITSKNLYIILAKDFLLVWFHLNNSSSAIGFNANCPTMFLCSDWETYWIPYWLVQPLTFEPVTWSLFWNGLFKTQHATVLRIVQRAIGTYENLPLNSSNHQMYLPISTLLRKPN